MITRLVAPARNGALRPRFVVSALCILAVLTVSPRARAEQRLRVQVDQRGDFLLVGNTLGWDCAGGNAAPAPVLGTVPAPFDCGLNADDSSIDVFWRADAPTDGAATAELANTAAAARSTSFVDLPAGATVTHAFLYWGARRTGNAADASVVIERPGAFSQVITAGASSVVPIAGGVVYESVADVTALVRSSGRGAYRVAGIDIESLPSTYEDVLFAGWALVVLYQLDSEPSRNLALFDGLDDVNVGQPSSVKLSGFLVPNSGFDAKLGTIVYEGDEVFSGDSLLFGQAPLDASHRLSDALNPADNFFNGTRSRLGVAVSSVGDLPQLSGQPRSMAGLDLDVIDVTARMTPGQSSVDLQATSSLDHYFLGAFVTSIATFRPDFSSSLKSVLDVNGGDVLPGDQLEYKITASNTGNDASANTVLSDVLPVGTTLVPGSISVVSGDSLGAKTDAADADQAAYDAATRTLTVSLGAGASGTTGGSIAASASSVITFRVTVDASTRGIIANQGSIEASGARGAPRSTTLTDGNATVPGNTSTEIPVSGCTTNADCGGGTPVCEVSTGTCVQCVTNTQCPGPRSTCDVTPNVCICGGAPSTCQDTDRDGIADPDEIRQGTDPSDADSDDDGVPDGSEMTPFDDTDGDGLINALDPDSDDDGLFDGTESGYSCSNLDTNVKLGHCKPDADAGQTVTDPNDPDSDDGSARDGCEDDNLNGKLDPGERDPTAGHGADDSKNVDSDGDGLSDPEEGTLGSNPKDQDSDDDGLPDGAERNPADDTDGDGLRNVLDPDSDDDALYDGTESGKDCSNPDTKPGHCKPDADLGKTTTSPVRPDTDAGGARDGAEDSDHDGGFDAGERDPTAGHGADDTAVIDTDGDRLSDGEEGGLGSDPRDADSDDDGVRDGDESNPGDDTDGDGKRNVIDPDSDGDGLQDGTERGSLCVDPATDRSKNQCVPDGDAGKTTTSMVNPDTDRGGVPDGVEDPDHNGVIDPGEGDPNNPIDDLPATGTDTDPLSEISVTGGGCRCGIAAPRSHAPWTASLSMSVLALLWTRRRRSRLMP